MHKRFMRYLWLLKPAPRPDPAPRSATGDPGSRGWLHEILGGAGGPAFRKVGPECTRGEGAAWMIYFVCFDGAFVSAVQSNFQGRETDASASIRSQNIKRSTELYCKMRLYRTPSKSSSGLAYYASQGGPICQRRSPEGKLKPRLKMSPPGFRRTAWSSLVMRYGSTFSCSVQSRNRDADG